MELDKSQIKLLGLSTKEVRVLTALRSGSNTPLLINKETSVSRPAIYEILDRLHARGLVKTNIVDGRKFWSQAKTRDIEESLYNTKKQLLNFDEGEEEVHTQSDSTVIVHRGNEAIKKLFKTMLSENKGQRIHMTTTDFVTEGWSGVMGLEGINEFNHLIKGGGFITEVISPVGWFESETARLGTQWAKNFEGRTAMSNEVSGKYLDHAGQMWVFKNSIYLISMNEKLIIEVRNSEIQKMIKSVYMFIQDNSRKFDVNERLRQLMEKGSEK